MHPDVTVLGAGIIGTSTAFHLAKRGLRVVLADRRGVGEETSYGNAGVIEGSTVFPPAFPSNIGALLRVAFKHAPEANYHISHLPKILPWLASYWFATRPKRLVEYATLMRPLFSRAVQEHEALLGEAGAMCYLRKNGWLKLFRSDRTFAATLRERNVAQSLGVQYQTPSVEEVLTLESSLKPVFRHAIHCADAASLTNPLAVTQSYAKSFIAFGGEMVLADVRTLHRHDTRWCIHTMQGQLAAHTIVIALGPWTPDVLNLLDIYLPLGIKRGYHLHFKPRGGSGLNRPTLDADVGYYVAPMEQGLRVTTGVEFAARDAPPTPVQFDRLMPRALELFPLGEKVEAEPWMGCRPCFPDSIPVIGRAPRRDGIWLAFGHAHWGLTLGPATGRLIAEMITGETPFCDPVPYSAKRFL